MGIAVFQGVGQFSCQVLLQIATVRPSGTVTYSHSETMSVQYHTATVRQCQAQLHHTGHSETMPGTVTYSYSEIMPVTGTDIRSETVQGKVAVRPC
jgi:hypothetical protein